LAQYERPRREPPRDSSEVESGIEQLIERGKYEGQLCPKYAKRFSGIVFIVQSYLKGTMELHFQNFHFF
jgi:hypothetical protein